MPPRGAEDAPYPPKEGRDAPKAGRPLDEDDPCEAPDPPRVMSKLVRAANTDERRGG